MEKEIMIKMGRYIELSRKFTKSESDIFSEDNINAYNNGSVDLSPLNSSYVGVNTYYDDAIHFNGTLMIGDKEVYVDEDSGQLMTKDKAKPLTRGERYQASKMSDIQNKAKLIDEYDEYMELRRLLSEYFISLEKLTKK